MPRCSRAKPPKIFSARLRPRAARRSVSRPRSEVVLDEGERRQDLHVVLGGLDDLHVLRALRLALADDALALQLRVALLAVVFLDQPQEGLVAARLPDVRDVHMDALPQLAVPDNLGNLHAQRVA